MSHFSHEQDYGSSSHIGSNYQNGTNIANGKGYVPATRDVPTHDHHQYINGTKASGMSGNTSSRESLTLGFTNKDINKQPETQSKTSLYSDTYTPYE